jgi:FkbM family methyltransferase
VTADPTMQARADAAVDAFAAELSAMTAERPPQAIRASLAKGCWIYGGGEYGQLVCGELKAAGYPVLGFIDRRGGADFGTLLGLPVRHPDELTADQARGRALVGGVVNPTSGTGELRPYAESLPFDDFVAGADLPDALGPKVNTFWQGSRGFLLDHAQAMKAAWGKLGDIESLDAALGIVRYRIGGESSAHPPVDAEHMYLPVEFPGFDGPITFVDGGAFIGDTCAFMLEHGVEIGRYVAFEPDETNLKRLTAFVAKAPIAEATLMPCGLSDALRDLHFAGAKGPSSRITADAPAAATATTVIRCVALDETLPGLKPDFIKLDIEGAEMAALKGMRRTLETARPRLAVCLYHRPQDIWEIPAFVADVYGEVFIRQHGVFGWDTVLYAFP